MKILTARQMAEVDRLSSETYHVPSLLLMENAGRAVADELEKEHSDLASKRVFVFCGKGNNGGDGLVVARYLTLRGGRPEVFLFCDPAKLKGDVLLNWQMVRSLKLQVHILPKPTDWKAKSKKLAKPDLIVDALFGTGLSKPIGAEFRQQVDWINNSGPRTFVVSVDIPSGLFADSAKVPGVAVRAHLTVTFTALKLAHVLAPAADHAGRVVVAPIGSHPALLENPGYTMELIDRARVRKALPTRPRGSHKGTFGHVFVVAGSRGKSGAALMTGLAALRSGAGLVTLWLPEGLQKDVVGKVPELMTESLPQTREGTADLSGAQKVLDKASQSNTLVVGPGMGSNRSTRELIRVLIRRSPVAVVLDADGINAFAGDAAALRNDAAQPIVITPHPGEMARLTGISVAKVQNDRLETAQTFALEHGIFTVLKGFQTVIAAPSGRLLINSTGNPGMATGGSGDILAGVMARFVAGWNRHYQGIDIQPLSDYLSAAVYLHGLAGDLAAQDKGMESMIATDLLPYLPEAFKRVVRE